MKKCLKQIFSPDTTGQILTSFHRNVPYLTLFERCSQFFSSVHDSGEWGLIALEGHTEILKNSSSLNRRSDFFHNFTEIFLELPFSKLFAKF